MKSKPIDAVEAAKLNVELDDNAKNLSRRLRELGDQFGHELDDVFKGVRDADRPQYMLDFADALQAFRGAVDQQT